MIFFNTKNEEKTMAGLLDEKLRKVVIYVFFDVYDGFGPYLAPCPPQPSALSPQLCDVRE